MRTDIEIIPQGAMALIVPLTGAGRAWVRRNVDAEDWQIVGECSIAADMRLAYDIAAGAEGDGLNVKR